MAYSLRSPKDRNIPIRYRAENGINRSGDSDTAYHGSDPSTDHCQPRRDLTTGLQPFTSRPSHFSQSRSPPQAKSPTTAKKSCRPAPKLVWRSYLSSKRTMARVKHFRRRNEPKSRICEAREANHDDSGDKAVENTAPNSPSDAQQPLMHPNPRSYPMGFLPSPNFDAPAWTSTGHFAVAERVKASTESHELSLCTIVYIMELMYKEGACPADMDPEQKEWYQTLRTQWLPGEDLVAKEHIHFSTLYPSLRSTIIEQLHSSIPSGAPFFSTYTPVKHLLGLTDAEFDRITQENSDIWASENEIPPHLRALKRQDSGAPIDPDLPPKGEIVKAIRFLRQEALPGSLLGEWQFPIPHVEVFIPSFRLRDATTEDLTEEEQECRVPPSEPRTKRKYTKKTPKQPRHHAPPPSTPRAGAVSAHKRHRQRAVQPGIDPRAMRKRRVKTDLGFNVEGWVGKENRAPRGSGGDGDEQVGVWDVPPLKAAEQVEAPGEEWGEVPALFSGGLV